MLKCINPRIRFQEFKSWWKPIKLIDLGLSLGGTAIESEFNSEGKYKVISIGSYSEESKYKDQGIRAVYSQKTEKRILDKDDLTMILNDKTSTGKIIGRVLLIDEDNSYVYNQRTQRISLNKNKFVPGFIFQLLNADINRNKIVRSAQGNTQIYVNWSDISNLDYLIPESIEEQSAIGSFFRTLDDLLASYKDNLANYQSLKATMLTKMFPKAGQTVPEIRLDGFEGEWKKDTFEPYLTESRISGDTGLTAKKITVKLWGKGVIEKEEKYAGSSNTQYFIRKAGQFIYSKLDFQNQAFGIIPNELDGYQSTLDLPTFDIQNIDPKFLLEYVMRREFYEYQGLIANGSRKAKRIHPENFLDMPVRIPSLEEQQAIGTYFSNLDNLINSYQEKISQLETLKKKLLQDMFI